MKVLLLLALLCLTSCQSRLQPWHLTSIPARNKQFALQRLAYYSHNRQSGLDLVLDQNVKGVSGHLAVHSWQVPPHDQNSHQALIQMTDDKGAQVAFIGDRLEGGQRVNLPKEALTYIIAILKEGGSVAIQVGNFSSRIEPSNFSKEYRQFDKP